jgi:hypothetical protein
MSPYGSDPVSISLELSTASARMSTAGVATTMINPPTAAMERRTAAEEQPPASSFYAPPLIRAHYNPRVYGNSSSTASFFILFSSSTPARHERLHAAVRLGERGQVARIPAFVGIAGDAKRSGLHTQLPYLHTE